jgi:hypothetical protein
MHSTTARRLAFLLLTNRAKSDQISISQWRNGDGYRTPRFMPANRLFDVFPMALLKRQANEAGFILGERILQRDI